MPAAFFLVSGLFIGRAMMVDDVFQVHEDAGARCYRRRDPTTPRDRPRTSLFAVAWLVVFWRTSSDDYLILLIAAGCSAVSVVVDAASKAPFNSRYVLEDGFKLPGIAGWLGYLGRSATGSSPAAARRQQPMIAAVGSAVWRGGRRPTDAP